MKIKNLVLTAVAATLLLGSTGYAQDDAKVPEDSTGSLLDKLPAWMDQVYIGAGMGSAFSFTDIKQYPTGAPVLQYRTEIGYGFNAFAGYKLNPFLSFTGSLAWNRLNGTKRSIPAWFTASVLQWDASFRLNVANLIHKASIDTRKFDVNLLGGIGISAFRSSAHTLSSGYSSDPVIAVAGYNSLDLEDKRRRTLEGSVYGGIGVSYRVTPNIDIYVDMKGYYLNSDYLDAVVSVNASNDIYTYNSLGAIYHFGGKAAVRNEAKEDPNAKLDEILEKLKDTDGDGVADYLDKDNNTPAGVKVYADGTSVDTDGDAVADYLDQERVSPCKEVDANGVSKDGDTDGVADCNDIEPNTAAGAQVDSKGKAIATGPVGISPVVTSTEGGETASSGGVISGLPSAFFASNSSSVSYKNYASLTQVAQFMKANPGAKLVVVGNSDKSGTASYNKVLGERRAKTVVNYLVTRNGIDAARFSIESKGSEDPISTRRNSGQDRRVDFLLAQ
jgi:outer membrane protein OmpA-like peptidoglycan-associated protein